MARPEDACGPDQEGCPAFIFLHGNNRTARGTIEHFVSLPGKGWLVALPQSDYVLWTDGHSWPDHEMGTALLKERTAKLDEEYSLDPARRIVGGFSMGGEVALAAALNGEVEAAGFVCIGLAGANTSDPDQWSPYINRAKGRGLRGVIVQGEEDYTVPLENVEVVVDKLNQAGIETKLVMAPGTAHESPGEMEGLLEEAFEFIGRT